MRVFRICKRDYARDISRIGAAKSGGHWNSKGTRMLYTAESLALCTVELAVHLPLGIIPKDYCFVEFELPDDSISILDASQLPSQWNAYPHPDHPQKLGDQFIANCKSLALKVPSAAVEGSFNFLINPLHPLISMVQIIRVEPYQFDSRLFVQS